MRIASFARQKKAGDLIVLDMREVCSFCDYFVIMSGESHRQVQAFAQLIHEELGKEGIKALSRLPANDESGWIVLDYGSVVVHVFYNEAREYYGLERLWSDAKRVRIPRKTSSS